MIWYKHNFDKTQPRSLKNCMLFSIFQLKRKWWDKKKKNTENHIKTCQILHLLKNWKDFEKFISAQANSSWLFQSDPRNMSPWISVMNKHHLSIAKPKIRSKTKPIAGCSISMRSLNLLWCRGKYLLRLNLAWKFWKTFESGIEDWLAKFHVFAM